MTGRIECCWTHTRVPCFPETRSHQKNVTMKLKPNTPRNWLMQTRNVLLFRSSLLEQRLTKLTNQLLLWGYSGIGLRPGLPCSSSSPSAWLDIHLELVILLIFDNLSCSLLSHQTYSTSLAMIPPLEGLVHRLDSSWLKPTLKNIVSDWISYLSFHYGV